MTCKHEWRLLEKWLRNKDDTTFTYSKEMHKFYCTKCLKIKIIGVKK